jgi:membrane-associated HD superfamily phosphohydrolase
MVTGAPRFLSLGLGVFFILFAAHAKDLAAYRAGDVAEESIITPVALDVVDAEATAARKAAEALKLPAIFRSYPSPTNGIIEDFTSAFASVRSLFSAALQEKFGDFTNADEIVSAPDFTKFLNVFNRQKIPFPISAELAGIWTRGDDDSVIHARLLNALLAMTRRPIRPDDLPAGFALGETLRLAPVNGPRVSLTLAEAERGKLVTVTSVTTVSRLRDLFRKPFSPPEQAMARGLAKLLRTNCEIDPVLTRQARDRDTQQLVVMNHYNAGQSIVVAGEIIDAKTADVLAQLNEKLMPSQLTTQLAAQREQLRAQLERAAAQKILDQANPPRTTSASNRDLWLLAALAGGILVAVGAWILVRRRRPVQLLPMRMEKLPLPTQDFLPADLSPQLTQILKDAVVQGLAAQRNELLHAQQAAATEINALVHRLDELKAPMQDRLRSYQDRIGELEKDLAERNEENRELLKVKIEMTRRQLEAERDRNRVGFN